ANAVPAECPLYRSGHLQRNRRCPLWANSGRCVFIRLPYRFGRARSPTQKADVIVAAVTFQTELREELQLWPVVTLHTACRVVRTSNRSAFRLRSPDLHPGTHPSTRRIPDLVFFPSASICCDSSSSFLVSF